MKKKSFLMKLALEMGLDSIAWSLRRTYCPVKKSDLVLEVGSGGNPYFRSNVLIDAYEQTRERHWVPLVKDRPLVIGFAENLPFKNKIFDFVIASHVFEHTLDPISFLKELQRVAKAGYIEVPDAFMERINPYKDHRIEITEREHKLLIRRKKSSIVDNDLVELYEQRLKHIITNETMRKHPFEFHLRYYWSEKIDFEILNPEVDISWVPKDNTELKYNVNKSLTAKFKSKILDIIRKIMSQNKRNKNIQIKALLACPKCKSANLLIEKETISCSNCKSNYKIKNGIPYMH